MTKRWRLKTNSSNILLVLITLILVKAEWVRGVKTNSLDHIDDTLDNSVEDWRNQSQVLVGNGQIADYFFSSSVNNSSFILEGINKCLDNFQLITCVKMLLLSRINDAASFMKEMGVGQQDVRLLNGVFVFKIKNQTSESVPDEINDNGLTLDEEIAVKVKRIFWRRSLLVNLFPKVKIEIEPAPGKTSDFVCFSYSIRNELDSGVQKYNEEGRKKKKRKGGGMPMMMIVPPLIMLGLMPFTLASLKAMVMNAVMINMMALNGAIFMTIRNLVFGPRQGDNVKYVNYGYSKNRQTQSKRPVLIIHSPAAFVKQPPVHRKPVRGHHSSYHVQQNQFLESADSYNYNQYPGGEHYSDSDDTYYVIDQDEEKYKRQGQDVHRRNDLRHVSGI